MNEKIWMKRVLIPLWVVQILVLLAFTAASALALYAVDQVDDNFDESVVNVLNTAAAVQLAFSVFTIVLDIVEIILAATHRLGPVANIVMQCIKSLIWTVFFVIVIIGAVNSSSGGLSIFLVLVLFLTCMGQLIYGAVIVHRHRKGTLNRGKYSLAAGGNAQGTAYSTPYNAPPQTGSHGYSTGTIPQPSAYSAPTAYKQTGAAHDYYGGGAPQNSYEMHGTSRY